MNDKIKLLTFHKISKIFPGVKALSNITFDVKAGSIHALMGENGAGKSTLLKILSGLYQPDEGELRLNNVPIVNNNTAKALKNRIAIIYQELNLIPELTVAENIYLGQFPIKNGCVDKKLLNQNAKQILLRLGETISPDTPLKELSIGQQQMVEIAKALSRKAQVIAFDEPTSSLSNREIQNLFKVIRELRDSGCIIIYVSHRMEEIFSLCDAITIFKDGTHVKTEYDIHQLTNEKLVSLMVGRNINDIYHYTPREYQGPGLFVKNLKGEKLSSEVSFSVQKGEILGLFGLVGAGRTELCRLIFGADPKQQGEIFFEDQKLQINSPKNAISYGITYCPEDRKACGIVPILSVKENINMSARPNHLSLNTFIQEDWEDINAKKQIAALRVKTPSEYQLIGNLSGGNQQKVILGRWLSLNTKVIILDEPTRGIDVGAKSEIYQFIYELANKGVCVIIISSDLPEVLGLSDRLLVMKNGAITGELARSQFSEEAALKYAMLNKN
ncbi:L-arabinose ABC transporter ATP-binding protein AraG [Gallibacterium salpingitidis]|uniref:L-arabinose ABC transporter ATP-binding protein AraG n=1 Tax=Gallibacterium salpingitidis TaxID=505341 RepID=UPI002670926B|nr:L-arabinose ABC transporter ATP-binding protein AraG [Gallibacterium salpingitidis]WKS99180.1 L-arabinose ABC transporter ATP-binding protein AraG [Gallibacterium salpingitidis]